MQRNNSDSPAASDWYSVAKAAAEITTGRRSIYKAVRTGQLRAARIGGRGDLRIHKDWLRAWLEGLAGDGR